MHDNIGTDKLLADNGTFTLCIITVSVIIADKLWADDTKANSF